jgi:hypothetical protein
MLEAITRRTPLHGAYDATTAGDSWRRMLAFCAEHL